MFILLYPHNTMNKPKATLTIYCPSLLIYVSPTSLDWQLSVSLNFDIWHNWFVQLYDTDPQDGW